MKSHILKITAALAAFGFATSAAHAVAVLTLNDGVNPIVTVQDGSGSDQNANAGVVQYSGAIGIWSVNVAVGSTKPFETGPVPNMHLGSFNASSGAGTMTVSFTDTFTFAQANNLLTGIGGFQPNGSVSYSVVVNGVTYNVGSSNSAAFAFSSGYIPYTAGTYDITQRAVITHTAAGTTSIDAGVNRAPDAGSTLALLGGALVALGLLRRRIS